jgi:hypothetical protein
MVAGGKGEVMDPGLKGEKMWAVVRVVGVGAVNRGMGQRCEEGDEGV